MVVGVDGDCGRGVGGHDRLRRFDINDIMIVRHTEQIEQAESGRIDCAADGSAEDVSRLRAAAQGVGSGGAYISEVGIPEVRMSNKGAIVITPCV